MVTPAQSAATTKYKKTHTRRFVLECSKAKDADIIEHLEKVDGKNAFIKEAIREKIAKEKADY